MFDDSFKSRYTTLPFATYERNKTSSDVSASDPILHNHREVELIAIIGGKAEVCINGETSAVSEGDVLVIAPYMLHRIIFLSGHNFSHKCLCFDLSIIPDKSIKNELESGNCIISPVIKASDTNASYFSELICNAFYAHSIGKSGWELEVIGNMCMFFARLKNGDYIKHGNSAGNQMCRRIIDFIDRNHTSAITSADASSELFISESYFCRIFKANFGYPFQKYLCMYRIEKSKTLLRTTDMSVSEIAASVGFNSFSYFSKMFGELVSQTPSQYRKT